ncbi:MAG TPA: hypothetical protein VIM36_04345, partial [Gemmatimonadaceae bacterium]
MFSAQYENSSVAPNGVAANGGSSLLRLFATLALLSGTLAPSARSALRGALPVLQPNRNVESAGVLRNGVLTVTLEAKE